MIRVTLRAHPGSRRRQVALRSDGSLEVHVPAPALDGRANRAILEALGEALELRPAQVRLVRGERSRSKLVTLELADPDELRRRLAGRDKAGRRA